MIDTAKFETMERVAEKLYRAGVFSAEVKSPDTAFAIILAGDELGFEPMASARSIALVKGKVSLSADAMIGIVKRSSQCAAWHVVETSATECTITTTRVGDVPTTLSYTIAMAQRAGLTGSQTWRAHPEAMLRARCGAALARAVYPDVCGGLYEPDEAAEIKRNGAHASTADGPSDVDPGAEPSDIAEALVSAVAECPTPDDVRGLWRAQLQRLSAGEPADRDAVWRACCERVVATGGAGVRSKTAAANYLRAPVEAAPAALPAADPFAAVTRHADDEDGDAVVADVVRVIRAQGTLAAADRAALWGAALACLAALEVADGETRLRAALTPPDAPKPRARKPPAPPADAHGDAVAATQTAGAQALRVVLDADVAEARLVTDAAAWEAHLARHVAARSPVFTLAGGYHKRRPAFVEAGVAEARYAATLAAIEAREQRGPDAARQALDGYSTRRVLPKGAGEVIVIRGRNREAIVAERVGRTG